MLGLRMQLGLRVSTRHNDPGTDVSKFTCDRLIDLGRLGCLALHDLLGIGTPDDSIMGVDRTGQVDIVDRRVVDQCLTDLGVPFEGHEQAFFE